MSNTIILFGILAEMIVHTILLLPTSFPLVQISALPVSTLEAVPHACAVLSFTGNRAGGIPEAGTALDDGNANIYQLSRLRLVSVTQP